jgi:hypothetical protein
MFSGFSDVNILVVLDLQKVEIFKHIRADGSIYSCFQKFVRILRIGDARSVLTAVY